MPQVPTYGGRRVAATPIPSARQTNLPSASSFGADFGLQIAQFGLSEFDRIMGERRDMANQVALLNAENQLLEFERDVMRDPQSGALTRQGRDALSLPEEIGGRFQKKIAEITESLSNDEQRLAFGRVSSGRLHSVEMQISTHVFNEIQQIEQLERKAYLENLINRTAQIADNATPAMLHDVAAELQRGREAIDRAGMGPEAAEVLKRQFSTAVHLGVLAELADGHPSKARAYYEAAEDEIDVDSRERARSFIEEGSRQTAAQNEVERIMLLGLSETEAIAEARSSLEGVREDDTVQRLKVRYAERDNQQRKAKEEAYLGYTNRVEEAGTTDVIPRAEWHNLTQTERRNLDSYVKSRLVNGEPDTSWGYYYSKIDSLNTPEGIDAFKKANLYAEGRHRLGDTEFKQLVALQLSLRGAKSPTSDPNYQRVSTNGQILKDTLIGAGIKEDSKEAIALRREYDIRVLNFQERFPDARLTDPELQEILDTIISETVFVPSDSVFDFFPFGRSPFGDTKRLIDLTIDDVPTKDQTAIRRFIEDAGLPVTDAAIIEWWVESQRRIKAGGGGGG